MEDNKIGNIFLCVFLLLLLICILGLFGLIVIELKSRYIDVQLKERLLYSGDSYTQEVNNIG